MTQFDSATRTSLAPGQALRLQLDRRITLVVVRGAVMVIALGKAPVGPSSWCDTARPARRSRFPGAG
ncbi:MAG: hypothetical protein JWQ41_3196 [Variovorax sp.]|nr:hypothetical protein [Variovorax sp.]